MNEQPDTEQIKAQFAREIARLIDDRKLSDAEAGERLSLAAADISRIRNSELSCFSIDRLIDLLNILDQHVEVRIRPGAPNALLSIVEHMAEVTANIPPEVWEKLPTDLAANHDHYLYGAPKRD